LTARGRGIQREIAQRTLSKRKLIQFIKKFHKDYKAGWVHYDICRRLETFMEDVEKGLHPRLMLFVPPRHGKSQIVSQDLPAWMFGHHPEWEIVISSYNADLPEGFSRNIREVVQTDEYKTIFPGTLISKDSRSIQRWNTTKKGQLLAVGRGGGLTGKGFHIGIIDDPLKDAEEADSELIRERLWDWYSSTFYTRQHPGAGILVVLTRWHDDDLAGRLIQQMNELKKEGVDPEHIDNWEIIQYPAIALDDEYINADGSITTEPASEKSVFVRSKGEALHPDRYNEQYLKKVKATIQPRHWSALYQQNPVPDEGAYFQKAMFRYIKEPPRHELLTVCIAGDLAIGQKQVNDWTVFAVAGLDHHGQIYILDIVRFRGDAHRIVETALDLSKKYSPAMLGFEKGMIEMSIMPQLKKRMHERKLFPPLAEGKQALSPNKDKQARGRPLQGRMQQGMVYFAEEPWLEDLQHEFLRFPSGVHDDIVDAVSWVVTMLLGQPVPRNPNKKAKKSWKDRLKKLDRDSKDPMAA
ncbi:MAG: phage terminase large subunit, partial [Gammaproteobacteria bacterium]|nr:phage terminase large subunit [Gammaproteobacteria bacterium]